MSAASSEAIPSTAWADLFGVASNNRLEFIEPDIVDGFLRIPKEVREEGEKRWENCLVGQFMGSAPSIAAICTEIELGRRE
ncbi:hypothetical protein LINPERPRIM_LOCUS41029 [Linum perenne]